MICTNDIHIKIYHIKDISHETEYRHIYPREVFEHIEIAMTNWLKIHIHTFRALVINNITRYNFFLVLITHTLCAYAHTSYKRTIASHPSPSLCMRECVCVCV